MGHVVSALLAILGVLVATFLPFASGGYDPLAEPVADLAWMLGRGGLLLVPVSALWLRQYRRRPPPSHVPTWLTRLTIGVCALVSLVLILVAYSFGALFAASTGVVAGLTTRWLIRRLCAPGRRPARAALLMAVGPLAAVIAQSTLLDSVAEHARRRGMANSAPLIAEIEQYRERHGRYPDSILALYGDVKPAIMGVERYHYEPSGESYNLLFEEPALAFGLRHFLVYNPRDAQRVTVHETDRLRLDDAGLDADNAGYTLVQPLRERHWKRFTFRS